MGDSVLQADVFQLKGAELNTHSWEGPHEVSALKGAGRSRVGAVDECLWSGTVGSCQEKSKPEESKIKALNSF